MTFGQAFKAAYAGSVAFLRAHPLLALLPVAVELVQHGIEYRLGMYDSLAAAKATDAHPLRMAFGFLKVLALLPAGYWVARFLAWKDRGRTGQCDGPALRLFAWVVLFHGVLAAIELFVLPRSGPVLLAGFVVGLLVNALLAAWSAAAALGNPAIGPAASIRIMAPQLAWTIAFQLVAILPLMVPHYALAAAAILGPKALLWPLLIADSLLVGWLAVLIAAIGWYAAIRAAVRARVGLIPPA